MNRRPHARRARSAIVAWALGLVLSVSATAHQGQTAGVRPFLRDGTLVGGETTWGPVYKEGDHYERVCEEAVGSNPTFYHRLDNGDLLVGTPLGLLITRDKGCSYQSLDDGPLASEWISALAQSERQPSRLHIITATAGTPNGVWRSDDGGETFSETALQLEGRVFTSIASDEDGMALFLGGFDGSVQLPTVVASPDGIAYDERTFTDYVRVTVFAVEGADLIAELRLPQGGSDLVRIGADLEVAEIIANFSEPVSDYVRLGDDRYVTLSRTRLFRARDFGAFEEVPDGPSGCLFVVDEGTQLWGCGYLRHLGHFLALEDDDSFTPYIGFGEVVERTCPDGTAGDVACRFGPLVFPDGGVMDEPADGGPADAGGDEPEPAPGCPCDETQGGNGAPVALGGAVYGVFAALTYRRRRRRQL